MIIENPEHLNEFPIPVNSGKKENTTFYIYFLWWNDTIVYIGQTVNLTSRILSHVKSKCFNKVTYNLYENISKEDILQIERTNINHYSPVFNDDTKAVFKTPEFLFRRKGDSGETFLVNKVYHPNNEPYSYRYYYYNGINFYAIRTNGISVSIHKDEEESIIFLNHNDFKVEIINNVPTVILIEKIRKTEVSKPKAKKIKEKAELGFPSKQKEYSPRTYNNTLNLQTSLPFGKYKGKQMWEVIKNDKGYAKWIVTAWKGEIAQIVMLKIRE